jgi:hypothetical protein
MIFKSTLYYSAEDRPCRSRYIVGLCRAERLAYASYQYYRDKLEARHKLNRNTNYSIMT